MQIVAMAQDLFAKGGVLMWFLLAASLAGMTFALERALACTRKKLVPSGLADQLRATLGEGGLEAGRQFLAGNRSALARLLDMEEGRIVADTLLRRLKRKKKSGAVV